MNASQPPRRLVRTIAAVVAGFLAIVILSVGTDMAMRASGVFPPADQPMSGALFALAAAYRIVYCIGGGWLTARIAPARPMRHALMLGVMGLIVSTIGTVTTWNRGPEFGPHWYPLTLIVTALPCAWLGGRLRRPAEEDEG